MTSGLSTLHSLKKNLTLADKWVVGNIVSVSWGDHLGFGEGEGKLHQPDSVRRRMEVWRRELDAEIVHWREMRSFREACFFDARRGGEPVFGCNPPVSWDEFGVVCSAARDQGMKPYLYVTLFDEGWPLAPEEERERSHHNSQHAKDFCWQSRFSRCHPHYCAVDRDGNRRQWGVLSLAYREVREYHRNRYRQMLSEGEFAGLFLCLRSQSRPAEFADQFGFNEPARNRFLEETGQDVWNGGFNPGLWRKHLGEELTRFLKELREDLDASAVRLAVGVPRGDVLGPPLGNTALDWRGWIKQGIVDELVIDQNSSRCPSMWLDLWPMHRGTGYLQNYLTGENLPDLLTDLQIHYSPAVLGSSTELFVARQWHERSPVLEEELSNQESVSGLVFSSFRHDNPEALARADWRR